MNYQEEQAQPARRIPYVAHQEIAEQLERMQKISVIKPLKIT